ncbi:MAG: class I SAM-dependent methyltransferase [Gemmatimonadales bacterium]
MSLIGMPAAWSRVAREYHRQIAPDFARAARRLCQELGVGSADCVLDVACGPGTAAAAARASRARKVVGVDYARDMLVVASAEARDDPAVHYAAANALSLPFPARRFDVVISTFGLIFAPDPELAVREAARVLRRGGRLGLLAWPPDGSIGEYQRVAFRHLDIPPSAHDPFQWGVPAQARVWLSAGFGDVGLLPVEVPFEAESPESAWRVLNTATGRVAAAYAELDSGGRARLDSEMVRFFEAFRRSDGRVFWPRQAMMITARRA